MHSFLRQCKTTSYSTAQAALLLTVYVFFLLIASGVLQVDLQLDAQLDTRGSYDVLQLIGVNFGSTTLMPYGNADGAGAGLWFVQILLLAQVLCLPACNLMAATLVSGVLAFVVAAVAWTTGGGASLSLINYGCFSVVVFLGVMVLSSIVEQVLSYGRLWQAFKQYVPPDVANQYVAQEESKELGNELRELTILFVDIHGFSSLAEQLEPARLTQLLNRYFDLVSEVIVKHGGTIDKFMGDAVMAFWGAPYPISDHAERGVLAAIEIQEKIHELADDWRLAQLPGVKVGVGVSTGPSFVGHLGSKHRMSYTVIGDTVNTAQRLEKATREYKVPVIVSQATVAQAPKYFCRQLDIIQVTGKHQFLTVFQPLMPKSKVSDELAAEIERHHHALKFYQQRRWSEAGKLFSQLQAASDDKAFYESYLDRIDNLQEQERPVPPQFTEDHRDSA